MHLNCSEFFGILFYFILFYFILFYFFYFFCFHFILFRFILVYTFIPMAQYYLSIFSDLLETNSLDFPITSDPYDSNQDMKSNIEAFYRSIRYSIRVNDRISGLINAYYLGYLLEVRLSTPSQRRRYRNVLSKHYIDSCTRVYNLYKILGIRQIYCTRRTSFWMFRKVSRATYIQLIQDAFTLL